MLMYYQYVRDSEGVAKFDTPFPELSKVDLIEYLPQFEALVLTNPEGECFYAPMTKDMAEGLMKDIARISVNGAVELVGVVIYESDEDGPDLNDDDVSNLFLKCRGQRYKAQRL